MGRYVGRPMGESLLTQVNFWEGENSRAERQACYVTRDSNRIGSLGATNPITNRFSDARTALGRPGWIDGLRLAISPVARNQYEGMTHLPDKTVASLAAVDRVMGFGT